MRLQYLLLFVAVLIPIVVAIIFTSQEGYGEGHFGIFERVVPVCYPPGREPPAADFTLIDQYNRTVTLSELWSKPVLVTFTYTYCPDVCPVMHLVLNKTLPLVPGLFGAVLDVSLDPDRDTPRRLLDYSKGNNYNWTFLTGSYSLLEAVWKAYGVTRYVENRGGTPYIVHDVVWAVVQDGKILGVVKGIPSPETLADLLKKIVRREC
ncbi:MAG: SCO family protein [Pyrobaculum sp.]|uniref:SCO family protein n=1 Tax=Pyrobaculum sp. TaxID=2004705 RepID=UPI003170C2E8